MAEVIATPCLAEAGTLTTNAETICAGGNIEVGATGNQTESSYLQYYFLYSQDNLNNTTFAASSVNGVFSGFVAGDYLVCSYNECADCTPNPSPITTNLNDIYQTGTIQDGCFDIECTTINIPETFEPNIAGSGQVTGTNNVGQNIFIAEVCGGTAPFDIDFVLSGGFATVNDYPSENAGCLNYQIVYGNGVEWTLTVTDANNCSNESVLFTNDGLPSNPLPQIVGFEVGLETCVGDADGFISIEVAGGEDSCGEYTYNWSGPNGFNTSISNLSTGNEITGLALGFYNVIVTDCVGTTATEDIFVGRKTGRGRGRGGCKTSGKDGENFNGNENLKVFPNPFADYTAIEFSLPQTSKVWLSVYSIDGRKVAEILMGEAIEGNTTQRMGFDAKGLQSGLYLLELKTESGLRQQQQLIVVK
ncbi:MAG: T9SS type A sorting domain-containing protein [Chitinophagales bacterium]